MNKKIKEKLDEYAEFDISEIFNIKPFQDNERTRDNSTYIQKTFHPIVRIFGGALRDIIADMKINDLDILVSPKTLPHVEKILEKNGYRYFEELSNYEHMEQYKDIQIISEPHTYIKGKKLIQLIRPRFNNTESMVDNFTKLISNVDINCCGISYDGKTLYENCKYAIRCAYDKTFFVQNTIMHTNRTSTRKQKLIERGWEEIKISEANIRNMEIDNIINSINIEYTTEHMFKEKHFSDDDKYFY